MIQRLQSVFLAIVVIAMSSYMVVKIATIYTEDEQAVMTAFSKVYTSSGKTESTIGLSIVASLAILTAIYSISRYKNRMTQMKLGALNSLFMGGCIALSVYYISTVPETAKIGYETGFYLPLVGLMFNLLANRFIRRDERMVRDSDRLR